ncbi:MAG TPA: CorA family divalent cation transporter, partial [Clostridia bacterium]|nr:CorA family divalent cation transporter [Clostridia bacterium]
FLPLTLFVGWYGMNFKYMPELGWRYGYLGFGAFILLTSGLILFYLRKRKLL